jgi:DNA-binding transcriptional regulator GbsR (MarR family)
LEYGKINKSYFLDEFKTIQEFQQTKKDFITKKIDKKIKATRENFDNLINYCDSTKQDCSRKNIAKMF